MVTQVANSEVDGVQCGLGWVVLEFGFRFGVVGRGLDARKVFESEVDIHSARSAVEAGEVEGEGY